MLAQWAVLENKKRIAIPLSPKVGTKKAKEPHIKPRLFCL